MILKPTGHAEIDHQHAILNSMLDKIDNVCEESKRNARHNCATCPPPYCLNCKDSLSKVMDDTVSFMVGHNTYEEKLMQLLPELPECQLHIEKHKSAHQEIAKRIHQLSFNYDGENPKKIGDQLRHVIHAWLGEHIPMFDVQFDVQLADRLSKTLVGEIYFDRELVAMLDSHVFINRPVGQVEASKLPQSVDADKLEDVKNRFDSLTPKQQEVCLLAAEGLMNKNIAEKLGTSINTIKTHRADVFRKMNATTLIDLVRKVDLIHPTIAVKQHQTKFATNMSSHLPSNLNIIVVDDCEIVRQTIVSALSSMGHLARGVADGNALDDEIESDAPDVVLLDIELGKDQEDGFAIAARLRKTLYCGIIMITAHGELDSRIRALEEGADAYLVKPIDFGELAAVMQSVMRRLCKQDAVTQPI
ncbi:MAG: response regulator [Gallionellaceae bacterium]